MEPDRLYISSEVREIIQKIKENKYLSFDTNKEYFLYAMALGSDMPTKFANKKDGLFQEKDLYDEDKAIMYAAVLKELRNIELLADKKRVYEVAQEMANTGFKMIEDSMNNNSIENLEKRLLAELDKKYQIIKEGE